MAPVGKVWEKRNARGRASNRARIIVLFIDLFMGIVYFLAWVLSKDLSNDGVYDNIKPPHFWRVLWGSVMFPGLLNYLFAPSSF
jgi:hypothetical protein